MDEGSALPRRRASDDDSGGATTLTSARLARYLDRVESLIGRDAVGALNASRQAMRVADRSGVKGDRLAALLAVGRALNDAERFAEAVDPQHRRVGAQ
jgi:hypothetical protein